MRKRKRNEKAEPAEQRLFIGNCALAIDTLSKADREASLIRLQKAEQIMQRNDLKKQGYRMIGKYCVKETFAGEESLTSLLAQYVERSIAVRC